LLKCAYQQQPLQKSNHFFAGDGAGVGKGRTIAGIIYENYLAGRKRALWLVTCCLLQHRVAV